MCCVADGARGRCLPSIAGGVGRTKHVCALVCWLGICACATPVHAGKRCPNTAAATRHGAQTWHQTLMPCCARCMHTCASDALNIYPAPIHAHARVLVGAHTCVHTGLERRAEISRFLCIRSRRRRERDLMPTHIHQQVPLLRPRTPFRDREP